MDLLIFLKSLSLNLQKVGNIFAQDAERKRFHQITALRNLRQSPLIATVITIQQTRMKIPSM